MALPSCRKCPKPTPMDTIAGDFVRCPVCGDSRTFDQQDLNDIHDISWP